MTDTDSEDVDFVSEKRRRRQNDRRTVSCNVFVLVVTLLTLALLATGLGLGLGIGLVSRTTEFASVGEVHSDSYGIPARLETVTMDKLVNSTDLDMKTGFAISTPPTTREYVLNISQAYAAPDGFYKPMILVNGQSPGPLVEANMGDMLSIQVNNQMANTSTSIHWHGVDQKNSTWMDGVHGITQCGIPPGESFTYRFTVTDQRGTFWYHSHLSNQYTDGLFGPLVIHDPDEMVPKVDDEKIVFLGDHYHTYGAILKESYLEPSSTWDPDESGVEPLADNLLMNGQNVYDCTVTSSTYPPPAVADDDDTPQAPACTGGRLYTTKVRTGQTTRLRLINHSSFLSYWFTIDNHTLSIVEVDGVEVEPVPAAGVHVNIGQRYSVLVRADGRRGNYHMRAALPRSCFLPFTTYNSTGLRSAGYEVLGVLSYDDVDVGDAAVGTPAGSRNPWGAADNPVPPAAHDEGCDDMPFDMAVPMRRLDAYDVSEDNTYSIVFQFRQAGEVNRIFINKTSWDPYQNNATLWLSLDQNFTSEAPGSYSNWDFRLDQQVLLLPAANRGAQVVINSLDTMEHPFHLHFQIVGWGAGQYQGGETTTWRLQNPMRRDTVTVPQQSHIVIRFMTDNPGVWTMHCHVAWHMEAGMLVQFIERPDDLKRLVENMDPDTKAQSLRFCTRT